MRRIAVDYAGLPGIRAERPAFCPGDRSAVRTRTTPQTLGGYGIIEPGRFEVETLKVGLRHRVGGADGGTGVRRGRWASRGAARHCAAAAGERADFADERPVPHPGLIGAAYDGSVESEQALTCAKELAVALRGELRLITVIPELSIGPPGKSHMNVDRDAYREAYERALKGVRSLAAEGVLEEGDPAAVLSRSGVDLDLLVVGSRGYGPVRRTLLGGVSGEVIRTAPCPVVVVPRGLSVLRKGRVGEKASASRATRQYSGNR